MTVSEYFLVIQKEYLIAEFRKRIYRHPKDKKFYSKVMDFKKEKIENIASRNKLNSIFTSEKLLNSLKKELFDVNGFPKFKMIDTDLMNYFFIGSEFSYDGDSYSLVEYNGNSLTIKDLNGNLLVVDSSKAFRII